VSLANGISLLENMPEIDLGNDLEESFKFFSNRFPEIVVSKEDDLSDRAGYLENDKIFKNKKTKGSHVIGCGQSIMDEWLYINALGDIFMCCDDFNFDTVFANIKDNDLVSIWNSNKRSDAIKNTFDTLCRNCAIAIWDN
jgi:radical SAM protein with 4Fe4S-binding SPASM domain